METNFDDIRPYNDDEIRPVMEELLCDEQFDREMRIVAPWLPRWSRNLLIRAAFVGIHTTLDIQKRIMVHVLGYILSRSSRRITFAHPTVNPGPERFTFVSNHRDIVLDSAILDLLLFRAHFPTTCEIAIGDNLLILPWIKKLVRLCKAFVVRRNLSPRELLVSSRHLSRYMHYAINEKKENIWIAQREGRAKDSNDRTQESVLKMLAMGGEGTLVEKLKQLHVVPLTISYEYDPCDFLKAREFQMKRDNPDFRKTQQDDLDSMRNGIFGKKGRIHYQAASCINAWLDEMDGLPKTEFYTAVAQRMDREIHLGYRLFPGNYVAADLVQGSSTRAMHYTAKQKAHFEQYIHQRLEMIELPGKDIPFLHAQLLAMYANPTFNHEKALQG